MLSNLFLDTFRPVFPVIGLDRFTYARLNVPSFNTNLFVAALVVGNVLAW